MFVVLSVNKKIYLVHSRTHLTQRASQSRKRNFQKEVPSYGIFRISLRTNNSDRNIYEARQIQYVFLIEMRSFLHVMVVDVATYFKIWK